MHQEADWNVLTCLPGRHQFWASLGLPADAGTGRYSVYFALVDPYTSVPSVRLAKDNPRATVVVYVAGETLPGIIALLKRYGAKMGTVAMA